MGKYTPFARLGTGGMAEVFLAIARGPMGFDKLAVIKRLRNSQEDHVQMFLDEARLAARLSHPNIVHSYEVGEEHGRFFIAMEYLEGQSLRQLVMKLAAQEKGLSEPMIAFIASLVLKGLHHAHELCDFDGTPLGVVHRDVSPQNLFITYSGEVKLLDFGIAKATFNSSHTDTGVLKGKVRYMAPEQATGKSVDRRLDIYAFGVVMWELLARRPLYQGEAVAILARIAGHECPTVKSVRPEVSDELDRIVGAALRREASDRYATADAMRVDIEQFLRGHDPAALERELAHLMNDLFADTRDDVRSRVKSFLARATVGEDAASSPRLSTSGDLPVLLSDSGPAVVVPASLSMTPGTGSSPPTASALKPLIRRRPVLVVSTGLLVLAGLAGAIVALTRSAPPAGAAATPVAPTTVRVHVETIPPGALIEWNGHPLDRSPADVTLDPGAQTLVLSHDGYEATMHPIAAKAGESVTFLEELKAKAVPVAPPPPSASAAPPPVAVPTPYFPQARWTPPVRTAVATTPTAAPTTTASAKPKIKVLDDSDSP
jgi:serine/threonine-protein kinase